MKMCVLQLVSAINIILYIDPFAISSYTFILASFFNPTLSTEQLVIFSQRLIYHMFSISFVQTLAILF